MLLHKILKSLVLLILFSLLISCSSLGKRQYEKLISGTEDYYTFVPNTVMNAISQGDKENLFTLYSPMNDQFDMWNLPVEKAVHWDQNAYFRVAQTLNEHLGNEPLENWKIKMIYLDYDCADVTKGFDRGLLEFFKVGEANKQEVRTVLTLDIMPGRKIVRRYQVGYTPVLENWETVDLRKTKISAEQAVDIAEKNGGSNIRVDVEDKCFVNLSILSSGSGYLGWTVTYSSIKTENSKSQDIFKILIDPQDGNFRVVSP